MFYGVCGHVTHAAPPVCPDNETGPPVHCPRSANSQTSETLCQHGSALINTETHSQVCLHERSSRERKKDRKNKVTNTNWKAEEEEEEEKSRAATNDYLVVCFD